MVAGLRSARDSIAGLYRGEIWVRADNSSGGGVRFVGAKPHRGLTPSSRGLGVAVGVVLAWVISVLALALPWETSLLAIEIAGIVGAAIGVVLARRGRTQMP